MCPFLPALSFSPPMHCLFIHSILIQLLPSPPHLSIPMHSICTLQLIWKTSTQFLPRFSKATRVFNPNFALTEYITAASSQDIKWKEPSGDGEKWVSLHWRHARDRAECSPWPARFPPAPPFPRNGWTPFMTLSPGFLFWKLTAISHNLLNRNPF